MQTTKENTATVKKERPKRTPINMTGRNVTTIKGKEPGFAYRIVNDVGDRVESMKERGYEVVVHEVSVGDRRVSKSKEVGGPVTLSVGGGIKGVVMRIPQEWYDEDQAQKQLIADAMEETIRQKVNPQTGERSGDYGEVSISK